MYFSISTPNYVIIMPPNWVDPANSLKTARKRMPCCHKPESQKVVLLQFKPICFQFWFLGELKLTAQFIFSQFFPFCFLPCVFNIFIFKIYFIDYAITVVPSFLLYTPFCPAPPLPALPPLSSCPWVIHIISLASSFPILFLTSSCLFCTYQLCFLFSVPFPPFSPFTLPADNPPRDLQFCDSIPVLVVCLVCFYLFYVQLLIVVSLLSFYCP